MSVLPSPTPYSETAAPTTGVEPGAPPAHPGDPPAAPDPFDPEKMRLPQACTAATGVKKLLTTVPVRKPSKESFVQTHPDEGYHFPAAVLELKAEGEMYLVDPGLLPALAGEPTVSARLLVTTITRQGALMLWPLKMPDENGRLDDWSRRALEAAKSA